MTSIEILNLLNENRPTKLELKHLHESIRADFSAEIEGREISPTLRTNGQVAFYTLGEITSKMLVAKKDMSYLRKITQFWIDKNKPHTTLLQSPSHNVLSEHISMSKLFNIPEQLYLVEGVKKVQNETGEDLSNYLALAPSQNIIPLPMSEL